MNNSKFKLTFSVDKKSFMNINYRPFLAGMIAVFVIKVATIMGMEPPTNLFHAPVPAAISTFDQIKPKLEQKVSTFQLKKSASLIPAAYAAADYDNANGYVVVDLETGDVLAEKQSSEKLSIASITKVMTAVVALDLASPDERFVVTQRAADRIPTKIGVVVGETMTLEELLNAALLTSANDAAEVIKEGIDAKYGEPVFMDAMNEKARIIGMNSSHFANPQGFDHPDHYSSADDLARLAHYALTKYPLIAEIVAKDYEFLPEDENHKQFDLYNWNGLIGVYPEAYGVKIGNTGDAGITTMVAANREDKNIAVILLGAPGVLERDLWSAQLLDLGYEKALGLEPVGVTEEQLREKYGSWEFWN